jgi:negative regulator of sigma E activity
MNEERPSEDLSEPRQVERDSQLSAMFDGELPAAECELLARRLTRDDALRSQWSRYSLIGAALRAERGVKLDDRVARRVQAVLAQDPAYGESADGVYAKPASTANAGRSSAQRWVRFTRPAVGAGIAAAVAAVSIFWLRGQGPETESLFAATPPGSEPAAIITPAATSITADAAAVSTSRVRTGTGEPERYSTPAPSAQTSLAPPARLANYVVAHSEYSGPLSRRMALLSVVGSETQPEMSVVADDADPNEGTGAPDAP